MTIGSRLTVSAARIAALCVALVGCTAQQAYSTGQAWQRNECQKVADATARSRCLEAAGLSAEAYRREAEAVKAAR